MDLSRGDRLFPFSSHRKRMTALINNSVGGDADGQRVYSKGAAEIILESCKFQTKANGELSSEIFLRSINSSTHIRRSVLVGIFHATCVLSSSTSSELGYLFHSMKACAPSSSGVSDELIRALVPQQSRLDGCHPIS